MAFCFDFQLDNPTVYQPIPKLGRDDMKLLIVNWIDLNQTRVR